MRLIDEKIYTGRNLYSHRLCIKLTVDVENLYDTPTNEIEGFNERLIISLPGLKDHHCSLGYKGGFLDRLDEGTYLPHVLEHMIIEMQNSLGFKRIKYGKARCVDKNIYNVIFEYELEEAGILCAQKAIECINSLIEGIDFNMKWEMEQIEKDISSIRLGPSTKGIYEEARKRNIPVIRIGKQSILQLGYGKKQKRVEATLSESTSCIAVDVACDKALTREVLKDACIPVADGGFADNLGDVLRLCNRVEYPVVIKPMDGNQGNGVTVGINDDNMAIWAYKVASKINRRVIIEKHIEGKDYRILVVNKKVVAVSLRMPPCVIGDGEHNIWELVEMENENPLRGYGHEKPLTKIVIDEITINYLRSRGLSLEYVPHAGEQIILRFNANLSTGGVAKDCTDIIHPDNIECAIRAAEAVGLDVAGVDVLTRNISEPISINGGVVLEVNAAPGIRMHMHPSFGKSRNVSAYIVDYLFPDEESFFIPLVSVTGTNGKTTTTRMISHILSLRGLCVGMTTTSGIYINNNCILKGDTTGPDSARTILMDRRVEAAVLETARGGIVRRGLGYELADVGVITNISEDHLGIDGINTMEELIDAKSIVVESVKKDGYAVLNADDTSVNILSEHVRGNIIYFSKNSESLILKRHLLDGGKAVFLKDDFICYGDGEKIETIINIKDIPSTIDGRLVYNIENSMAAASACIGLKLETSLISKGLKSFLLDEVQNPGRFNLYTINNFKVVVDYGHNIGGYKAVLDGLRKMDYNRLVGVIGVPGDRMDQNIIEVGGISGEGFDYIYIKEDMDKRGRKLGEVAALLELGVKTKGKGREGYEVILNEGEALKEAMEKAKDGDIVVVFYEDYDLIMKTINNFKESKEQSQIKKDAM